jgi:hypothetical protein
MYVSSILFQNILHDLFLMLLIQISSPTQSNLLSNISHIIPLTVFYQSCVLPSNLCYIQHFGNSAKFGKPVHGEILRYSVSVWYELKDENLDL